MHKISTNDDIYKKEREQAVKQRKLVADNLIDVSWTQLNESLCVVSSEPVSPATVDAVGKMLHLLGCRYVSDIHHLSMDRKSKRKHCDRALARRHSLMKRKNAPHPKLVRKSRSSSASSETVSDSGMAVPTRKRRCGSSSDFSKMPKRPCLSKSQQSSEQYENSERNSTENDNPTAEKNHDSADLGSFDSDALSAEDITEHENTLDEILQEFENKHINEAST